MLNGKVGFEFWKLKMLNLKFGILDCRKNSFASGFEFDMLKNKLYYEIGSYVYVTN